MEQYSITFYKKAQEDLEEIVRYLNQFHTGTALKYYDLIIEKIGSLSNLPERCALVRDDLLQLKRYRCLIAGNYVVFFVIKESNVQIRRILYNIRQYVDIL